MGAGASSSQQGTIQEATDELLRNCEYYIADTSDISREEVELANESWRLVMEDDSPKYKKLKAEDPTFDSNSCLSWFYDSFFILSNERDESAAKLYEGNLKVQIRALTGMMSASIKLFAGKKEQVDVILNRIAHGHYKKGVRVYQYPIVGTCLFATMEYCLGPAWNEPTKRAWHRIFSHMLRVLIPVGMEDERAHGDTESAPPVRTTVGTTSAGNKSAVETTSAADVNKEKMKNSTEGEGPSTAPTAELNVATIDSINSPIEVTAN